MIVYKLVRNEDGLYKSFFVHGTDFEVIYEIGKRAIPKIGKLFCFKSIEDARKYICHDFRYNETLLKCEVDKKAIHKYKTQSSSFLYIKNFWESKRNKKKVKECIKGYPDKETIFVDYLDVLEDIKEEFMGGAK